MIRKEMTTHFPKLVAHRKGRRQKVISVDNDESGVTVDRAFAVETDIMDYVFLPQRLRVISFVFNGLQYCYLLILILIGCMYNILPMYCYGMFAV